MTDDAALQYFARTATLRMRGTKLPALANLKSLSWLGLPAPEMVTHLELSGLPLVSDGAVASLVAKCDCLESLVLRCAWSAVSRAPPS